MTLKYTMNAGKKASEHRIASSTATPKAFKGLQAALAEASTADLSVAIAFALGNASEEKAGRKGKKRKLRSAGRGKKVLTKSAMRRRKAKEGGLHGDVAALFETFIQATRFVRFDGAHQVPPSAAVAFSALFMQAQKGLAKVKDNKIIVRRDWKLAKDKLRGAYAIARDLAGFANAGKT